MHMTRNVEKRPETAWIGKGDRPASREIFRRKRERPARTIYFAG